MRRTIERRTATVVEEPPPGDVLTHADVQRAATKLKEASVPHVLCPTCGELRFLIDVGPGIGIGCWECVWARIHVRAAERADRSGDVKEGIRLLRLIFRKLTQLFALAGPAPEAHEPLRIIRAAGGCICTTCGREYREHAADPREPWLTILCGGTWVKL